MKSLRIIVLTATLMLVPQVFATTFVCQGTVSRIYIDRPGNVYIRASYRGDFTAMCSLKTLKDGVSPEVCASWLDMLKTAYSDNETIAVRYFNVAAADCFNLPTYGNAPTPTYVMLKELSIPVQ